MIALVPPPLRSRPTGQKRKPIDLEGLTRPPPLWTDRSFCYDSTHNSRGREASVSCR